MSFVDDDFYTMDAAQRRQITAATAINSDMDYAYHLQLEEAIAASLSFHLPSSPSSSASASASSSAALPPAKVIDKTQPQVPLFFLEEYWPLFLEPMDQLEFALKVERTREELGRRIDQRKLSKESDRMDEDMPEGSSSNVKDEIFRVYFKGLREKVTEMLSESGFLGGIGVAICDSRGESVFEFSEPLYDNGTSKHSAELKSLIEGLKVAAALGLERVQFFSDYYPIIQFATGRRVPRQPKNQQLVNQLVQLQGKFAYCQTSHISKRDIPSVFRLAREAIDSQRNKHAESSGKMSLFETCVICLENTDISQIFSFDGCMHRYCYSCMNQHVKAKLRDGMLPKCPHEKCTSELKIDSCSKFLTSNLLEVMTERLKEASIPVAEKVYCPYPKCSALMSKSDLLQYSKLAFVRPETGGRRCIKCKGNFCIACNVPWHVNMSCSEYKERNPNPSASDVKLKSLAASKLWRQCIKCKHMIELAQGCFHMTCRCGFEFCYTCGAEYKDKKGTCKCPLWNEIHILNGHQDPDDDTDDENEGFNL